MYEPAALGVFLARSASRRSAERAADLAADGLDYADKFASYAKWLARSDVYGSPALWRGDGEIPEKECVDGGPLRSLPALTDWLEGTSILREAQVWQEALFENWREWGRDAWSRTVDEREQPSPRKSSSEDFCREHRHRRRFMLWAQIVQSRVHTVSVRDRAGKWVKTKCMVPVADAINTGPLVSTTLLHERRVDPLCVRDAETCGRRLRVADGVRERRYVAGEDSASVRVCATVAGESAPAVARRRRTSRKCGERLFFGCYLDQGGHEPHGGEILLEPRRRSPSGKMGRG